MTTRVTPNSASRSAVPTSNAATRWMIWSLSCVSSSTRPPWAPTTSGRLPAGAAGRKANLIRVLKATVKGPGAAPSTRLINGLRRPRTSGVSGQPLRFSPRNGRLPQGGTAAYQAYSRDAFLLVRRGRTAQQSDGSDRGCPLDTGVDPWMWHANGTTGEERLGAGGVEALSRPPARSPP